MYAVAMYGTMGADSGLLLAVLMGPVVYFLAMYVYYGMARLAFERRNYLLWGTIVAAVAVSYLLVGSSRLYLLLTGWTMLTAAGVLAGRLTDRGVRPRTIFIVGTAAVVVFGSAQLWPVWQELLRTAPESTESLVGEAQRQLSAIGESPERTREITDSLRKLFAAVFRLMPALMLLGNVVQFAIGYLLFVMWLDRFSLTKRQYEPFKFWRMPYGFVPVVAVAAVLRLVGGESLQVFADNLLAFLGVFYLVMGLALLEYYLRKIQFTTFMRVLLYLFLFFLPLVSLSAGMILGGLLFLAGFADSFADWRRTRLREFG